MLHVPYKGGAAQVLGVVTGESSALFSSLPLLFSHLRAGRLRALGVTSLERVDVAPALPTIAETLPGFEATQWWGMFAPARTPAAIVDDLNSTVGKILTHADIRQSFAADGAVPKGGSPQAFAAFHKAEYEKWGRVVSQMHVRSD
jgi:tripartite-type tricarboxylate transporter receptor subunit TctC